MPGAGLRWNAPVHFAREGAAVAVGLDRKLVAAAVVGGYADFGRRRRQSISPSGGEPAVLFGVVSLGEVVPALLRAAAGQRTSRSKSIRAAVLPNGQPIPESMIEELKKSRKELSCGARHLAPATVAVRRKGNELRFELFQPKVQQGALKSVIDAAANWLDRAAGLTETAVTVHCGGTRER